MPLGLAWDDLLVTRHKVLQANPQAKWLDVDASPTLFTPESGQVGEGASVMSAASLKRVLRWQHDTSVRVFFHAGLLDRAPSGFVKEDAAEVLAQVIAAGAFQGTPVAFSPHTLSPSCQLQVPVLESLGVLLQGCEPDAWQLSRCGLSDLGVSHRLAGARLVVGGDKHLPISKRCSATLLHELEAAGWELNCFKPTPAQSRPVDFVVRGGARRKTLYFKESRKMLQKPYLMALLMTEQDTAFGEVLRQRGVQIIKHLESDKYYTDLIALLDTPAKPDEEEAPDFDFAADGLEAESRVGPTASRTGKMRGLVQFRLPASFAWGCVSFKQTKNQFSLQCDCPRRSHRRKLPSGGITMCTFSGVAKTEEDFNILVRRMKHWVVQGLAEKSSRHQHEQLKREIKKLPSSSLPTALELEFRMPPLDRAVTDSEGEDKGVARGGRKRKASSLVAQAARTTPSSQAAPAAARARAPAASASQAAPAAASATAAAASAAQPTGSVDGVASSTSSSSSSSSGSSDSSSGSDSD